MWQSFVDCREVSSHGKYSVTAEVTHFGPVTAETKCLYSVACKDKLTFWYTQGDKMAVALTMTSSQNYYTVTYEDKVCKVARDGGGQVGSGVKMSKQGLKCLHVIFDQDASKKTLQEYKPHLNKSATKPADRVVVVEAVTYCEDGVHCTRAYEIAPKQIDVGHETIGEFVVALTIKPNPEQENLYDSDFLRSYETRVDTKTVAGTLWRVQSKIVDGKDVKSYVHANDSRAVLVDYTAMHTGMPSRLLTASALRRHVGYPAGGVPLHSIFPVDSGATMPSVANASAGMHFTGLLGAQAPSDGGNEAVPKPPKRKKIKFLQDGQGE
jgi:hypothetical protein